MYIICAFNVKECECKIDLEYEEFVYNFTLLSVQSGVCGTRAKVSRLPDYCN